MPPFLRGTLLSRLPLALALPIAFLRGRSGTRLNWFFSVITVLATFVSSILLLLALAGTTGAEEKLRAKISGLDSHIAIRRTVPYEPLCDYGKVMRQLTALPTVLAVSPYVLSDVQIQSENGLVAPVKLKGVVPESETRTTDINDYLLSKMSQSFEKALNQSGPDFPVVIGSRIAKRLGLALGQQITIIKPGLTSRPYPGVITGIFESGTFHDSEIAYTTLTAGQTVGGGRPDCVFAVAVRTDDPMTSSQVARKIGALMGTGFHAADWSTLNPEFRAMISLLQRWILVLNLVLIAYSAMFSAGAVLLVIYQKRRELAVLLVMGMTPLHARMAVALVGTILGFFGVVVAVGLDPEACLLLTRYQVVTLPITQANISYVPFIPHISHVVFVALLQTIIPTLFGWFVSGDLDRIDPAEVIRDE